MDFTKEISNFIESKIKEEIAKSQVLTKKIFTFSNILNKGTVITGSIAKQHYGFKLPHSPKDKDLILIDESFEDIYLLADSIMPKDYRTGSWNSIIVKKEEEVHFKAPIASFVFNNEFVEIFENVNNLDHFTRGYVPLQELVKCAKEWNRDKDKFFLEQIKNLSCR